jgi:hypothetical protein
MNGLVRSGMGLLGVVVFYVVVNLVLVGGQELYHHQDQVTLDSMERVLETERADIHRAAMELQALSGAVDSTEIEISRLKSSITGIENRYPAGIPTTLYAGYSRDVDRHNTLARAHNASLAQYEALYAAYSARVDGFNSMVDSANALAKSIGGTWYIVPVPGPRRSH